MIYKEFKGKKLSALGMGCMRLPVLEGKDQQIDVPQVEKMVALALEQGVNYFDTAWGYHGGSSETVMGQVLSAYPRDSYFLASKFPGYDLGNMGKVREIFEKQLEKCRTDYFDFYLFHNVCEMNIEGYLDPKNGIFDYLMAQKQAGRIKHLGFSAHGSAEVMARFLERYGADMEFCLLQLNWLDWAFQGGAEKVALLDKHHIPVWVMEPLRGGKLAALPEADAARLAALRPEETVPGWAFRFLQSVPQVQVILSGMSDLAQLEQNLQTFRTEQPLKEAEKQALLALGREMTARIALPCTSCRYCTAHCPMELDIPRLLNLYNEHAFTGGGFIAPMALGALPAEKQPAACIGCRACEQLCPQNIRIADALADFAAKLK